MIIRIKQYFESHLSISQTQDDADVEHQLRLACATLMVEMVFVDGSLHETEENKLRHMIQKHFDISEQETSELLAIAHEEKHAATDYYQFTSLINRHYTQEQKTRLVEQLWTLAYADNEIDRFEEHLVRKLAELLHVPHSAFIRAKHNAVDKSL